MAIDPRLIEQGRQGGGSALGSLVGGIAASRKRRIEEDKARQLEEETLEREIKKINEQETQKRITTLLKAKQEQSEKTKGGENLLNRFFPENGETTARRGGLPKGVSISEGGVTITGQGEKGLPVESAGKFTMLKQAKSDIQGARELLFDEEGKFNRGLAGAANIPGGRAPIIGKLIPDVGFGTDVRKLNSRINNALEAKLRIETGAAATQEEFDRLQTRFGITAFDTAESAKDKLDRLEEFMDQAISTIDPSSKFSNKVGIKVDTKLDNQINSVLDNLGAE